MFICKAIREKDAVVISIEKSYYLLCRTLMHYSAKKDVYSKNENEFCIEVLNWKNSKIEVSIDFYEVRQNGNNWFQCRLLTPPGLAVRSSTTVVEFDGFKNCTSRVFDAFAESRCWAVRVTVVCKSSSKLSAKYSSN